MGYANLCVLDDGVTKRMGADENAHLYDVDSKTFRLRIYCETEPEVGGFIKVLPDVGPEIVLAHIAGPI